MAVEQVGQGAEAFEFHLSAIENEIIGPRVGSVQVAGRVEGLVGALGACAGAHLLRNTER